MQPDRHVPAKSSEESKSCIRLKPCYSLRPRLHLTLQAASTPAHGLCTIGTYRCWLDSKDFWGVPGLFKQNALGCKTPRSAKPLPTGQPQFLRSAQTAAATLPQPQLLRAATRASAGDSMV